MPSHLFSSFGGALLPVPCPLFFAAPILLTICADFLFHLANSAIKVLICQFAFPYDDYEPSLCLQLPPHILVPFLIPSNLLDPKGGICLGNHIVLTSLVPVPKTPVHKDHCSILWKDNIGRARKSFIIDPISESSSPQLFP